MKYKVIIFDLDGVLFKSTDIDTSFLFKIFPTMNMQIYRELVCANFYEGIKEFQLTNSKLLESDEEKTKRRDEHTKARLEMPLVDGIKDLLEELHSKGCVLAINSSALERNCLPLLEKQGIIKLFDFLGLVEMSESKVKKFEMMREKYGVDKKEMIFITDTLGDLREAEIAGIPTICVTWGVHDRSYFEREKHDNLVAIVDTVEELEKAILDKDKY